MKTKLAVAKKRGVQYTGTAKARASGDGVYAASDFLLSMVESSWAGFNGDHSRKMESAGKAQHELEKIEQQIAQLEALAGENQEAHRKLQQLHGRVTPCDSRSTPT